MKKTVLLFAGLLLAGLVHAGELDDAKALFEQKKYPEAMKLYTKLANAGNVEAQQSLGQMYWYGEAGEIDEAKAGPGSPRPPRRATRWPRIRW